MRSSRNSENRVSILRRTAREVRSYKVIMKALTAGLAMITTVLTVMYVSSALYKQTGSFTVQIDKFEMQKYGLTLSESRTMSHQTSHLNASIEENITNIAEESILDNVDQIDGVHNGPNYIAYTFYLQNAGTVELNTQYAVRISNITNGLDEAIRLKLYVNGVSTTYAKTRSDGSGAEPGTVEFASSTTMAEGRVDNLVPGAMTKFTVVVWIEGNDPDCVDWLIGGSMRIDMEMSVVH